MPRAGQWMGRGTTLDYESRAAQRRAAAERKWRVAREGEDGLSGRHGRGRAALIRAAAQVPQKGELRCVECKACVCVCLYGFVWRQAALHHSRWRPLAPQRQETNERPGQREAKRKAADGGVLGWEDGLCLLERERECVAHQRKRQGMKNTRAKLGYGPSTVASFSDPSESPPPMRSPAAFFLPTCSFLTLLSFASKSFCAPASPRRVALRACDAFPRAEMVRWRLSFTHTHTHTHTHTISPSTSSSLFCFRYPFLPLLCA
jgi:hypothetical protein